MSACMANENFFLHAQCTQVIFKNKNPFIKDKTNADETLSLVQNHYKMTEFPDTPILHRYKEDSIII